MSTTPRRDSNAVAVSKSCVFEVQKAQGAPWLVDVRSFEDGFQLYCCVELCVFEVQRTWLNASIQSNITYQTNPSYQSSPTGPPVVVYRCIVTYSNSATVSGYVRFTFNDKDAP